MAVVPAEVFTPEQERFLLSVAGVIVPAVSRLDEAGRSDFTSLVAGALAEKPPSMLRQFKLFLSVIRWLPVMFFLGRFDKLSPSRQAKVLRFFESAPLGLLRKGTWGLKTLVFMGYYGQSAVAEKVGYVPDFEGNRGLHAG
jgi:hypothetical protein